MENWRNSCKTVWGGKKLENHILWRIHSWKICEFVPGQKSQSFVALLKFKTPDLMRFFDRDSGQKKASWVKKSVDIYIIKHYYQTKYCIQIFTMCNFNKCFCPSSSRLFNRSFTLKCTLLAECQISVCCEIPLRNSFADTQMTVVCNKVEETAHTLQCTQ